jgi:hypothetical protein
VRAAPHPTVSNALGLRVEAIHQAVSIFEVFDRMGLPALRPETQQMRCPFHPDHSPSARVYADQNVLFCFTEQKRWDVIACVQDHWHLSFSDALAWLESTFGLGGVLPSLTSQLRITLSARPRPPLAALAQTLEGQLKAQKATLGYDRYATALLALDLLVKDGSSLPAGELQRRVDALGQVARGH